jgi:thiamine biosynthesis lipoprotein
MYFRVQNYILTIGLSLLCSNLDSQRITDTRQKLGSPFTITIESAYEKDAVEALETSFRLVDSLDRIFSDYISYSELNQINVSSYGQRLILSEDMYYLLDKSQQACLLSGGAFDVTTGKITHYWKRAIKHQQPIATDSLQRFRKYCGCEVYVLDKTTKTIIKNNDQFWLDLGGIAKGYIAQKVSDFLKKDFPIHLIDAGGDIVAGDPPSDASYWRVAVEKDGFAYHFIEFANQSIATSGATYQHIMIDHQIYSHIIDPKTGIGTQDKKNITIIASKGEDADWLATACTVLPPKKSKKLLKKMHAFKIQ